MWEAVGWDVGWCGDIKVYHEGVLEVLRDETYL